MKIDEETNLELRFEQFFLLFQKKNTAKIDWEDGVGCAPFNGFPLNLIR